MQPTTQKAIATQPPASFLPTPPTQAIVASVIVVLPVLVLLGVFGYRKYRGAVLRHQISMLEKIWRLSPKEKKS